MILMNDLVLFVSDFVFTFFFYFGNIENICKSKPVGSAKHNYKIKETQNRTVSKVVFYCIQWLDFALFYFFLDKNKKITGN